MTTLAGLIIWTHSCCSLCILLSPCSYWKWADSIEKIFITTITDSFPSRRSILVWRKKYKVRKALFRPCLVVLYCLMCFIFSLTRPSGTGRSQSCHVRLSVWHKSCYCLLWPNGESFCLFSYDRVVLRILNLKRHQNCKIGSKVMAISIPFVVHDKIVSFLISGTSLLWIMEESAGEGLWLLAFVMGGRWHVMCDMSHVTCYSFYTFIIFFNQKFHKSPKKAK